mmetsp:Transcript_23613/g.53267  ORF Transcript_23613/g.53267 Transcript_23613/m.53267 type:complete len:273 (-) Transcript_23613:283-1101(-)
MHRIDQIQQVLEFDGWEAYGQFSSKAGIGRVGLAGFGLGVIFGANLCLLIILVFVDAPFKGILAQWSLYLVALSGFHFSEFLVTALYKPESVSYDSFVINHSKAYTIAALASWLEFWLESLVLPGSFKRRPGVLCFGLVLVLLGQGLRAGAMWTAKANFNHLVMVDSREPGHRLVTHGVYKRLRHPSYFGWFWWCVGLQLLLSNPICTLAYAYAARDFFMKRIPIEEAALIRFYPNEYPAYMSRTYIGIPFVKGVDPPPSAGTGNSPSTKGD